MPAIFQMLSEMKCLVSKTSDYPLMFPSALAELTRPGPAVTLPVTLN